MIGSHRALRSRATVLALAATALVILVATLTPSYEMASSERALCLICGHRGAADAIDNVLLFIPFGVALGLARLTTLAALMAGFGLSLFVELAQFAIVPGRDASLSDLLFNTVGAGIGYAVLRTSARWVLPDSRRAGWLSLGAAAVAVSAVALTGYLLRPALPHSPYAAQWTESPGHLEQYRGRIVAATLGDVPIPARPLEQSGRVRDLLLAGAPLDIRMIAGPPTRRLGQLFAIVEHGSQREVLLLGIDRDDLFLRYRTRANDLRLDAGALRISNALAGLSTGSPGRVVISREAGGYCVAVNDVRTCEVAFTAANGWMLLYSIDAWRAWARGALGAGWLVTLLMPVGFWLRRRWSSFLALAVLGAGFTIVPGAVGLSPPSAVESVGGIVGLLLGVGVSSLVARRSAIATQSVVAQDRMTLHGHPSS